MNASHDRGPNAATLPEFELPAASPDDPQSVKTTITRPRDEAQTRPLLQHLVLALLSHYRLRPGQGLAYSNLAVHWAELGHNVPELATTLVALRRAGLLEPAGYSDSRIVLTRSGYLRCHSPPRNLEDGQQRWEAMRTLRRIYDLRQLPAA